MIRHIAILAAFSLVAGLSAASEQPTELNFGIISTESTVNLRPSWDPFLADLQKAVGIPVKSFFASDYSGIIEGMRFKKVDIAWFGNKSAILAVDRADGVVFAKVVALDGTEGYHSYIVVHQDSPFKAVDDLLAKGKDLVFSMGDPNSTSGTLVPGYYVFAKRGLDPKTTFKRLTNAKHEANLLSVLNKQADAATCASDVYDRFVSREAEKAAQIRILWKSELLPSDPMVYRKDLSDALKGKVTSFFTGYGAAPGQKEILANLKWSAFRASDNSQLIPIRELEFAKKKIEIEGDAKLSAEEKKAKAAEIDQQLAALRATPK